MSNENEKRLLMLVIDNKKYDWLDQYITGAQIRQLGGIGEGYDIFLKIKEPWTDELITNDTSVDLARPGVEHFFSVANEFHLIVNGRERIWKKREIGFREVVELAFATYTDKVTMVYTVAYEDGPKENPEGSMVRGSVVFVKNKMIFHVTATDKS